VLTRDRSHSHDWVLSAIARRWPVLAVDEYQDLGLPLHRIVKRLAFDGGVRLFAVGDPDQSVYGFPCQATDTKNSAENGRGECR
jgi:superfamily I DNA/RNA helicase